MFERLKEYFRKKDKVMVGKWRVGMPFILTPLDNYSVQVTYTCYEDETGKRTFKVLDYGHGMIEPKGLYYDWCKGWKTRKEGNFFHDNFPSYAEVKSGKEKPYVL